MIVGYIKEENFKFNFLKPIEVRYFDNKYILVVHSKTKDKKRIKQKIVKYINKLKIDTLVFSKELEGELEESLKESVCSMLQMKNVQVLNGKKLMEYMEFEVIKYVLNKQDAKTKQEEIYIIFKKDSNLDLNFLKQFIENFRVVNIVTNDLERLKNVQDNLLENDGILISVSNNKRKALKRAKYILNVNLNKEELEKYMINRNAIVINIKENVKYSIPSFDGININYFNIKCPDEFIEKFEKIGDNFDTAQLYESILFSENIHKRKLDDIYSKIKNDEIKITGLIGNNGIISDKEFKSMKVEVENRNKK